MSDAPATQVEVNLTDNQRLQMDLVDAHLEIAQLKAALADTEGKLALTQRELLARRFQLPGHLIDWNGRKYVEQPKKEEPKPAAPPANGAAPAAQPEATKPADKVVPMRGKKPNNRQPNTGSAK